MIKVINGQLFESIELKGVIDWYACDFMHKINFKARLHGIELDSHQKIEYVKTLL